MTGVRSNKILWAIGALAVGALAALALVGLTVVGCRRGPASSSATQTGRLSGSLKLAGSTSVLPLAQAAAEEFMKANPDVTVEVQGTGSSEGITAVSEGAADIGDSSRDLKDDEPKLGLVDHKVAIDAVVFIVNPANKVTGLTKDQAVGIFTGKVKNWKELGGANAPIEVVNRDEASGTRDAVQKLVLGEDAQFTKDAIVQPGTGQVKAAVAGSPGAVGYISFGYVDDTVKPLSYEGVNATRPTIESKDYTVQRDFHMFTKGEAKGLAKALIDFVLTDDFQKRVVSQQFIPVK